MAVSFSCSPVVMSTFFASTEPRFSNLSASIQMRRLHRLRCSAMFREVQNELEDRKCQLLRVIQDTQRGLVTTTEQRSSIEEALVSVEGFDAGDPIDLVELSGTWRLQYTSAPDVLILLESATRLPFFQVFKRQSLEITKGNGFDKCPSNLTVGLSTVGYREYGEHVKIGQIYQKFECGDESSGGVVRNVVKWSIPNFLEEQEGATLLVSAKFSVISLRNICLEFEEIAVQNIIISDDLQALIAPALLPRSFLSLQVLQFIQSFKAQVPVRRQGRNSVGGLYYLSYLDRNMLLGRAVGGGGVFVFTRAQALI